MDLSGRIRDLITVAKEQSKAPSVNKKWLNKTIARLEEAELFAGKVYDGRVLGIPTPDGSQVNPTPITGSNNSACTCTQVNGAIVAKDINCPVHAS